MTNLRSNIALVMVDLSIFAFLIAVGLYYGYFEMNPADFDVMLNFLLIFSVLFMAAGICLALTRRKTYRRGHNFDTVPGRIHRSR